MTPVERAEEMLRRLVKSKTKRPSALKQIAGMRKRLREMKAQAGPQGKPSTVGAKLSKQRVYQQRHEAKKKGLPVPPLPKLGNR